VTLGVNFNILHTFLRPPIPKALKDTDDITVFFYAFGIYEHESFSYNFDEIDTRSMQNETLSSSIGDDIDCEMKVTLAVTFLAGIMQVSSITVKN
jgi:hypothetical protein